MKLPTEKHRQTRKRTNGWRQVFGTVDASICCAKVPETRCDRRKIDIREQLSPRVIIGFLENALGRRRRAKAANEDLKIRNFETLSPAPRIGNHQRSVFVEKVREDSRLESLGRCVGKQRRIESIARVSGIRPSGRWTRSVSRFPAEILLKFMA